MDKDTIISSLIGLAGACGNNPKTALTDSLVIRALSFPLISPEADSRAVENLVEEIHAEKFTISPGCAQCTAPCGNTSDYDMDRLYTAEGAIRTLKLALLSRLEEIAAHEYKKQQAGEVISIHSDFFYKALSYISFDFEEERPLRELLDKAEQIKQQQQEE